MSYDGHQPHYRMTQDGRWVVCGPASMVLPGATVTVFRRSGSSKVETIESVGRTFDRGGVRMVYGYPVPSR